MALIVQKYGGTSVGAVERIAAVARRVITNVMKGDQVVVVLSAMSGETDRLINLAHEVMQQPDPRELDVLISTGEQVTISLLAMSLISMGYKARSYTGAQIPIVTDNAHNKARILTIDDTKIRADLARGYIVIAAGFQGMDECGNITTLGRGGSDTTAVALAAALKADECQIYTDVDGVYTTDPRVEPQARLLRRITFEEMLEMASLGAKVLQIRAVEFAGRYNVPLRVLNTFSSDPGTLIALEEKQMEQPLVSGIAFNRNEAKLTILGVPDKPGVAAQILGPVSEANVDVDMIIQNATSDGTSDFSFTVNRVDFDRTLALVEDCCKALDARQVLSDKKIAKISLVGVGMRSHAGIASKMFRTLGSEGINIQLVSTSEIKISVVVDEKYLELGVRALHAAFALEQIATEEVL